MKLTPAIIADCSCRDSDDLYQIAGWRPLPNPPVCYAQSSSFGFLSPSGGGSVFCGGDWCALRCCQLSIQPSGGWVGFYVEFLVPNSVNLSLKIVQQVFKPM